jgi:hypothetical protein
MRLCAMYADQCINDSESAYMRRCPESVKVRELQECGPPPKKPNLLRFKDVHGGM